LRRDQRILEEQIAVALETLERIESQPPFTLQPQLDDEAWLAARRKDIDEQTVTLHRQGEALKNHWEKLLGDAGYGTTFSQN